eukprot:252391-Prorocentrum_minimum.AAC.1
MKRQEREATRWLLAQLVLRACKRWYELATLGDMTCVALAVSKLTTCLSDRAQVGLPTQGWGGLVPTLSCCPRFCALDWRLYNLIPVSTSSIGCALIGLRWAASYGFFGPRTLGSPSHQKGPAFRKAGPYRT